MVNNRDSNGNLDGIRLRQAFRTGDAKATPIVPTNKRFAEPAVPATFSGFANPGAGNPQLYRVSTGHGGVMCEGCHGATHAEWPNANPNANDNVTANQLQGHTGAIAECSTCHGNAAGWHQQPERAARPAPDRLQQHAVVEQQRHRCPGNNFTNCATCHGGTSRSNSRGTVLSRALATRTFSGQTVQAGDAGRLRRCHSSSYWNNTCVNQ